MSESLMAETTWADFGAKHLDRRITKAIEEMGHTSPMLVQSQCIPICLQGKDVLARARTGSGKTLAFCIPVVQKLLTLADKGTSHQLGGVILVPSKELCVQVHSIVNQLLTFCFDVLTAECLVPGDRYAKSELPNIIITTPSSLLALLKQRKQKLSSLLQILAVDEADLMFSFGYEEDMKQVCKDLPSVYQAILMSATLNDEVEELKGMMLHKPAVLKLEEPELAGKLTQFYLPCKEEDKYLIVYSLVKLNLVQGKTLMFVSSTDRAYSFKLLLEKFSIPCEVLSSELPHKSRQSIIQAFNRSMFELLIATDNGFDTDDVTGLTSTMHIEDVDEEGFSGSDFSDEELSDEEVEPPAKRAKATKKTKDDDNAANDDEEDDEEDGDEEEEEDEDEEDNEEEEGDDDENKLSDEEEDDDDEDEEESDEEMPSKMDGEESEEEMKPKQKKKKKAEEESDLSGDEFSDMEEEPKEKKQKSVEADDSTKWSEAQWEEWESKREANRKNASARDGHFSVCRGLDLRDVSTVLNADMPKSSKSYVHRVGRTARGGATGTALSLVTEDETGILKKLDQIFPTDALQQLQLQMKDIERFRYRVSDMASGVNKKTITKARAYALQSEALMSKKLAAHFEENPEDRNALRIKMKHLRRGDAPESLKTIPSYLMPADFVAGDAVQAAISTQNAADQDRKRKRGKDPLKATGDNYVKRDRFTREKQLRREPDHATADIEDLPKISGRALWALNKGKRLNKRPMTRKQVALQRKFRLDAA